MQQNGEKARKAMKKRIILLIFTMGLLAACALRPTPMQQQGIYLDTIIQITVYRAKDKEIATQAMQLCEQYENLLSKTKEGSDIYRINHAGGEQVEIQKKTAEVLEIALEYGRLSMGCFDITIGTVNDLWDFKAEIPSLPDDAKLQEAVQQVDYRQVELTEEDDKYYCRIPAGMQLDLGGIAKGYIGDQMRIYMEEQGVENALLDLGGNLVTIGDKNGKYYDIGVRSPFQSDAVVATMQVEDTNVVTSGTYERYIEVDDKRYHHILDPHTGYPAETGIASVTIIADNGATADALSTACFVMGEQDGLALVESIPDAQCIFVMEGGEIITSSGVSEYHFQRVEHQPDK